MNSAAATSSRRSRCPPTTPTATASSDPGAVDGLVTEVRGLVEKPAPGTAPSSLAAIGRYILQPEVMRILGEGRRGAGGEIQLTDAMARADRPASRSTR